MDAGYKHTNIKSYSANSRSGKPDYSPEKTDARTRAASAQNEQLAGSDRRSMRMDESNRLAAKVMAKREEQQTKVQKRGRH